ncbi:MAG: hypothetical protein O2807_13440 [bacterium]|nr:hypothetical protein [bacterium]
MDDWKLTVKESGPLLDPAFDAEAEMFAAAEAAVEDAAGMIAARVRARTPEGASGGLRGAIAAEVRGKSLDTLRGRIAASLPYAAAVEQGRPPGGFPPWRPGSPLFRWVSQKFGSGETARISFLVARKIARRGTRGAHMFRDGFQESLPLIAARFQALGAEIARRLGG